MRWFRRHRLFGAQAALFALVIQFTLAFGHFHAVDVDHPTAPAAFALHIAFDHAGSSSDHGTKYPGNDACAICAAIHLTGSAQTAELPALPVPLTYFVSEVSFASEMLPDEPRCFEHRSRGPPQV